MPRSETRLFPALLRHWRTLRGLSQLDLALAADVSSRHVSFLETGRAQPSREMVLRLATTLSVPLREQNDLLRAAGFPDAFAEPGLEGGQPPGVAQAIDRMLAQQEPFPMTVLDRHYSVLRTNGGGTRLLARFIADPSALGARPNAFAVLFDPRLARPFVVDWERVAHAFVRSEAARACWRASSPIRARSAPGRTRLRSCSIPASRARSSSTGSASRTPSSDRRRHAPAGALHRRSERARRPAERVCGLVRSPPRAPVRRRLGARRARLRQIGGGTRLLARFIADPSALGARPNAFAVLFDPRLARPFVVDWERVAHAFVSRLHRETLAKPADAGLAALLRSLFEYPDVPEAWRQPDFSTPSDPTLTLRLKRDDLELAFLTTLTVFNAPQNVTLEELCLESYFPLDEATARACERIARG